MRFLIWSEEHQAWWRPNSAGYTTSLKQAGRYDSAQAGNIVEGANNCGKQFCEIALPVPRDLDSLIQLPTHR